MSAGQNPTKFSRVLELGPVHALTVSVLTEFVEALDEQRFTDAATITIDQYRDQRGETVTSVKLTARES